ncbi:MAG: helix-turn-helix domain-containing protein [Burkholderiales bacterium]|nr:helix-turn-helix domain-containing protein [Burkholderiales bacterium]
MPNTAAGSGAAGTFAQVKEEPAQRAGDTEQKFQPPRSPETRDYAPGGRGPWDSASCPPPAAQAPPLPTQNPMAPGLPAPMREFCLVSVLRNVLGVACWLVDSRIALRGVQMPFSAPAHQDAYSVLFTAPTQFGCAQAAIIFDARYLALPLRRDEAALQHMLQNALPLTVLQYRRDRLLVQQVRQALLQHPDATHSAEGLAHLLHLSPRTLHRQLHDEGASLQGLKDNVRRERATDLLLRTQRPIKQVAQAAGFQNEKSFIRAFKLWSGTTPAEFRRRQTESE